MKRTRRSAPVRGVTLEAPRVVASPYRPTWRFTDRQAVAYGRELGVDALRRQWRRVVFGRVDLNVPTYVLEAAIAA